MSGLSVRAIGETVASYYDLPINELLSSRKSRRVVEVRDTMCLLVRRHTGRSFPEIGRALGNRNHTTIDAASNRAEQRLADPIFAAEFADLEQAVSIVEIVQERSGKTIAEDIDPVDLATRIMSSRWSATRISIREIEALAAAVLSAHETLTSPSDEETSQ